MPSHLLRPATPSDARILAQLGRDTYLDTFVRGFQIPYPPEDLEAYLTESFAEETLRARLLEGGHAWWIAELHGEVAGFAHAGPTTLPHPDAQPSHAELKRLYIARGAQGIGLGRALLETALGWMQAHTAGPLWIGVWSGNHKAQRLYGHYGFTKAGEYDYPVGRWIDREFILRRP